MGITKKLDLFTVSFCIESDKKIEADNGLKLETRAIPNSNRIRMG